MKILVTGGNGLVGRNFREHPDIMNCEKFELLSPSSQELDLCDRNRVHDYIKKNKPDFIVHAAGFVGGIEANMSQPVQFLLKNMDMGLNIVRTASDLEVKNLINLGSSCMYPRNYASSVKFVG